MPKDHFLTGQTGYNIRNMLFTLSLKGIMQARDLAWDNLCFYKLENTNAATILDRICIYNSTTTR